MIPQKLKDSGLRRQLITVQVVALSPVPFLPLIHGLLRASVEQDPELGRECQFLPPIFVSEPFNRLTKQLDEPDVLALSCYPWSFQRNMKLAQWFKKRSPSALVVAGGGILATWTKNSLDYSRYVDIFVHGEGEITFREVLRQWLLPNPQWSSVPGISYWQGDHLVRNPDPEELPDLAESPSPYGHGYLDSAIAECRRRKLWFIALWETNRGCPYTCSFCQWGASSKNRLRLISDQTIASEIGFFTRNKIESIMLCDANFGILPRDTDIVDQLVEAKQQTGYPKRIRVNFAKDPNEQVFEISRRLHAHNMHLGTTFSPQSMNPSTLKAVSRSGAPLETLRKTLYCYAAEGIPTYSELILGLPLETRESFLRGIGELLDAGAYDIRHYELVLFPNLPISQPENLAHFGFECQDRELYAVDPSTPDDEREKVKMVISTKTMSRAQWLECRVFVEAVQILHTGRYTYYLSEYLHRKYGLAHHAFYEAMIDGARKHPNTALGSLIADLDDLFTSYRDDPSIPQMQLIASQPHLLAELEVYGHRGGWRPDQWAWLRLLLSVDCFYQEVRELLLSLNADASSEVDDLIRFQSDIMLRPDYDPEEGKVSYYQHDWPAFFQRPEMLRRQDTMIWYRDTYMGVNKQYRLKANDLRAFALAAVGPSYPFLRVRHYQHQLDEAEINHE